MAGTATMQPTLFERAFPAWAARRARSRLDLELIGHAREMARKYAGAVNDRFTADWNPTTTSADAELDLSLETLRNRSRDLVQNDPHAAAAIETVVTSTSGDRVRLQARAVGDEKPPAPAIGPSITPDMAERANRQAERAFAEIEDSIDGFRQSFSEFVELSVRQELESGETLAHLGNRRRDGSRLTGVVTLIEPDRLMTPAELVSDPKIRNGILFDGDDVPQTYFVAKEHPGGSGLFFNKNSFDELPAADVIHSYTVRRPGQSRGVPWFTPALIYFRHKQKSMEAEMIAQRFAACICAFIESAGAVDLVQGLASKDSTSATDREMTLKPGKIWALSPGQKVSFGNPTRPGEMWVPSMHEILRAIGTSLNIPYVVLANDFENVNYSSMRAALVQLQRFIGVRRWRQRTRVIRRLWSRCYDEAVMVGLIQAPGYLSRRFDYQQFRVQWPGSQWVDPWREVQADVLAVKSGLLPHEFIAAKYGADADELITQIQVEEERRKAAGLPSILDAQIGDRLFARLDDADETEPASDFDLFADRGRRRNGFHRHAT